LLGCHSVNQIYLCERNGVLSKNEDYTCLGALYHSKYDLAKTICNFFVEPVREFVYQLLDNWFIVYSTTPLTIPTKCRNGSTKEIFIQKHISKFHLSPGCSAQFHSHKVFSDLSIKLPSDFIQLEWTWEPTEDLFREAENYKLIRPELERLQNFGIDRPRLTDLQALIMQAKRIPGWSFPLNTTTGIILGILLLLLLVFIFFRCRARRLHRRKQKQNPVQPMGNNPVLYASAPQAVQLLPPQQQQSPHRCSTRCGYCSVDFPDEINTTDRSKPFKWSPPSTNTA
jgi:hypothetical protein